MKLKVILHPEKEGGYSAAIPNCFSCCDTVEEAVRNVREAAEGLLAILNDRQPFELEDRSANDVVQVIDL